MRRYALAGAGERGLEMYGAPLRTELADVADLVAIAEPNPIRLATALRWLSPLTPPTPGGRSTSQPAPIRGYGELAGLLEAERPDAVIVAARDDQHAALVVAALEAGADAIVEKPMAIDADGVRAIVEAERRTGRRLSVAFNYRYAPYASRVREILLAGTIGEVLSVDFHWYLDRSHGADYFRRWHRLRRHSGGLLVHKATHHFDLLGWWLADTPERVVADGTLRFYGPSRPQHGVSCRTCELATTCAFFYDISEDPDRVALYVEPAAADGYHRDGCVYDPAIDIEDSMTVLVRYRSGTLLCYSLAAHVAYEGFRAAFNGRLGRLELEVIESGPAADVEADAIVIAWPDGRREVEHIRRAGDGHAGGDAGLRAALFRGGPPDPLARAAGSAAGADAVLVGVAAERSIEEHRWITIDELR